MGCNCRKPKPPSTTKTSTQTGTQTGTQKSPSDGQKSGSGATSAYTLTTRTGSTLRFGSKLEAEAANARAGFTGTVRPA